MRKNLRTVYIVAAIISIVLYAFGVLTGVYIQKSVLSVVESDIDSIRNDIENAQQEYILFSFRGKESCAVLSALSDDINQKLNNLADELIRLENEGEKGTRFTELKKVYGSMSIRAWILRSSINDNCDENILPILYYYSVPCERCLDQGRTIDKIVEEGFYGKMAVYVLDKDIDTLLVKTLVKSHNITQAPSLVIEKDVYQGFVSKENLTDIICQRINATACARKKAS